MAKTGISSAEKTAPKPEAAEKPRRLKQPKYQSFKLQKRLKGEQTTGAVRVFAQAVRLLARHWKLFGGVVLLYVVLNTLLVQSFMMFTGLGEAKATVDPLFSGGWAEVLSGASLFAYFLGASGSSTSATAGVYQVILSLVFSLALIWLLRHLHAGHKVRLRDGFYRGMAPLVPFVLVLGVVALQLIPMSVGALLYGAVVSGGLAVTPIEQVLWALLLFVLMLISLYMLASSVFALYIVTLPDMTPMRALRTARQLVRHRRWAVLRKLLFLPLVLVVGAGTIIIPLILLATPVAPWAFFALSMLTLPIMHSYVYGLYRSLL